MAYGQACKSATQAWPYSVASCIYLLLFIEMWVIIAKKTIKTTKDKYFFEIRFWFSRFIKDAVRFSL
jgi:hypothetical protein